MNNKVRNILILIVFIVIGIFGAHQLLQRSSSFIFTKTTNLNEENIAGMQIYQDTSSKEFADKYMTGSEKMDNALFDYYKLSNGLIIATNKQKQIIRISINNQTKGTFKTSKGICLGSSVDEVISAYGENYYKRKDDIGVAVIGYVDKKNKVTMEFFNYNNKVTQIRYDITSMQ